MPLYQRKSGCRLLSNEYSITKTGTTIVAYFDPIAYLMSYDISPNEFKNSIIEFSYIAEKIGSNGGFTYGIYYGGTDMNNNVILYEAGLAAATRGMYSTGMKLVFTDSSVFFRSGLTVGGPLNNTATPSVLSVDLSSAKTISLAVSAMNGADSIILRGGTIIQYKI